MENKASPKILRNSQTEWDRHTQVHWRIERIKPIKTSLKCGLKTNYREQNQPDFDWSQNNEW